MGGMASWVHRNSFSVHSVCPAASNGIPFTSRGHDAGCSLSAPEDFSNKMIAFRIFAYLSVLEILPTHLTNVISVSLTSVRIFRVYILFCSWLNPPGNFLGPIGVGNGKLPGGIPLSPVFCHYLNTNLHQVTLNPGLQCQFGALFYPCGYDAPIFCVPSANRVRKVGDNGWYEIQPEDYFNFRDPTTARFPGFFLKLDSFSLRF